MITWIIIVLVIAAIIILIVKSSTHSDDQNDNNDDGGNGGDQDGNDSDDSNDDDSQLQTFVEVDDCGFRVINPWFNLKDGTCGFYDAYDEKNDYSTLFILSRLWGPDGQQIGETLKTDLSPYVFGKHLNEFESNPGNLTNIPEKGYRFEIQFVALN